jgi:hypothetical protein
MQKKLWKTVAGAAILLALAFGGCGFDLPQDTGEVDDPTLSPPPKGMVWAAIAAPGLAKSAAARTLTGTTGTGATKYHNNYAFIDYYEVYFLSRDGAEGGERFYSASAAKNNVLAVAVEPNRTYEVLLLAGDSERTLLASAYNSGSRIEEGKTSAISLRLDYVLSDPGDQISIPSDTATSGPYPWVVFKYTDAVLATTDATTYYDGVVGKDGYEVDKVTLHSDGGASRKVGDILTAKLGSTHGNLDTIIAKVTEIDALGKITNVSLVQGGYWLFGSDPSTASGIGVSCLLNGATSNVILDVVCKKRVDISEPTIPWLTYLPGIETAPTTDNPAGIKKRTNALKLKIKTGGLGNLIKAGDDTGSKGSLVLKKATLELSPVTTGERAYPKFVPVTVDADGYDSDAKKVAPTKWGESSVLDPTGTDDEIFLRYTIPAENLPENQKVFDTYGKLYYDLTYKAFTREEKVSEWHIRNGVEPNDIDVGKPVTDPGAGILVKIGNPGKFGKLTTVTANPNPKPAPYN